MVEAPGLPRYEEVPVLEDERPRAGDGRGPRVLRAFASEWEATRKWSWSYLGEVAERSRATVSVSRTVEEAGVVDKVDVPLAEAFRLLEAGGRSEKGSSHTQYYVKQFDLLSVLPDLRQDLPSVATLCTTPRRDRLSLPGCPIFDRASLTLLPMASSSSWWSSPIEHGLLLLLESVLSITRAAPELSTVSTVPPLFTTVFGWAGLPGSVTGLHADDEENIVVQLRGRKHFYIIDPKHAPLLSLNDRYDSGTICADADPRVERRASFPSLDKCPVFRVELSPGDGLYIPKGWYHFVHTPDTPKGDAPSAEPSLSLNFFVSSPSEMLWEGIPREFLDLFHSMGLYRASGPCVCHRTSAPPSPLPTLAICGASLTLIGTTAFLLSDAGTPTRRYLISLFQ